MRLDESTFNMITRILEQNNKKIAKNTIILAVQQALSLVVALYTSRVILRSLGIEDFGIFNVIAGFVTMFAFLNTSMNNAIQRFYNYEYGKNGEEGAKMVFNNALVIQLVLSVIVLFLLETIGLWYLNNRLVLPEDRFYSAFWVYQFSSFSLLFVIMQIPFSAAITAHERMLCFASVSILDSILKLIVAIFINHVSGDRLLIYGFLVFLINVSDFFIYAIYAIRNFSEIGLKKIPDWGSLIQMLTFSGWNFFGSFAGVAKEQGVNLILNNFFGPLVNAARGIAYQVSGALKSFVSTVMISGRPQLTQSYAQNNFSRTVQLMFSLSKASFLILLIFSIPIMFNIDYILHIWLSTDLPKDTGIFVNLVIVMSLIEAFSPPVSFVVHASGKMAKYQLVNSFITLLIIPVSYIILRFGVDAVSVFWLGIFFQLLCQVSSLLILKGIIMYSILEYLKCVIIPLLYVVVFSSFAVWFSCELFDGGFFRLMCTTIASTCCIMVSSYFFVLGTNEKLIIKAMINRILKR